MVRVQNFRKTNTLQWQSVIKKGFSKRNFIDVGKNIARLSEKDFAAISGISQRTLSRLKPDQNVSPQAAEVAISVIRVFHRATEVLGSEEKALDWLKTKNHALMNATPLECLSDRFGTEAVFDVLGRIDWGVYS